MEIEQVQAKEEKIEEPKPQKFYCGFYRGIGSPWCSIGQITEDEEYYPRYILDLKKTDRFNDTEYKVISFEI